MSNKDQEIINTITGIYRGAIHDFIRSEREQHPITIRPYSSVGKYDVILLDCPWSFQVWDRKTGHGRSAESHYGTISLWQIALLPILDLAAKNCALFIWGVWPSLIPNLEILLHAWSGDQKKDRFEYKTVAFNWWKLNPKWERYYKPLSMIKSYRMLERLFAFGMGYYTRANPEPCILAIRGNMPVETRSERNIIIAPIRRHSQKPDEQYEKIERLYPNKNYLEMFARNNRPGWDCFGNEVDSTITLEGWGRQ